MTKKDLRIVFFLQSKHLVPPLSFAREKALRNAVNSTSNETLATKSVITSNPNASIHRIDTVSYNSILQTHSKSE